MLHNVALHKLALRSGISHIDRECYAKRGLSCNTENASERCILVLFRKKEIRMKRLCSVYVLKYSFNFVLAMSRDFR